MQKLVKIVYITSIFLICFWIFTAFLGLFICIEFKENEVKSVYDIIRFFGLPMSVLLTLTGTVKKTDKSDVITSKILWTIFVSSISFFIMIITLFVGMCSWTTNKVFFEKKDDNTVQIVERKYGCGATDSDFPTYKLFKIKEIASYLIWVTDVDTNKINKNEWTKLNKKQK